MLIQMKWTPRVHLPRKFKPKSLKGKLKKFCVLFNGKCKITYSVTSYQSLASYIAKHSTAQLFLIIYFPPLTPAWISGAFTNAYRLMLNEQIISFSVFICSYMLTLCSYFSSVLYCSKRNKPLFISIPLVLNPLMQYDSNTLPKKCISGFRVLQIENFMLLQ